jgi:phenylpropionate dioxygenase-like ring-hydroxylating dioxygenase large terminal subunit
MLSHEDNMLLAQTGPGTPMGQLFRRYWTPVLLSNELPERDGAPVQVEVMSEKLVIYRNTDGAVGLMQELCPHRGTSLVMARNEESGLRCIYHGWKYDLAGQCVDMPTEPADTNFREKVRARAYPTVERGGMVWAYMGPPAKQPAFPNYHWMDLPEDQFEAWKILQENNYAQAIEGGIDSAHIDYLHGDLERYEKGRNRPPRIELETASYGFRYAALRNLGADTVGVRITPFVMPWTSFVPGEYGATKIWHAWVPKDDGACWEFDIHYNEAKPYDKKLRAYHWGFDVDPSGRKVRNLANWYQQDRELMKTTSFSGIFGVRVQDQAAQETMGRLMDRTQEHLGTTDMAVIAMRRILLNSAKALASGQEPIGLGAHIPYGDIRDAAFTMGPNDDWRAKNPLTAALVRS